MFKKATIVLLVVLALTISAVLVAAQNQLPGSGWLSGQQIQNVGTGPATIVFTAYDTAGNPSPCGSKPAAAGAGVNFSTNECQVGPGFVGSAVVSAEQPIAAVVNVANNPTGPAGGMYRGTDGSQVNKVIAFPLVKANFNNRTTTLYLQNASTGPTTIDVQFKMRNGQTYNKQYPNVPVNAMVVVSPADANIPAQQFGGATATASGSGVLAGTALEHQTTAQVAENLAAYTGFTEANYDSTAYCPLVRNGHSGALQTTGIDVQNVSAAAQKIKVTYTYRIGNGPTQTKVVESADAVAPGVSFNFYAQNGTYGMPVGALGAAKVEGSGGGDVAAIVTDTGLGRTPRRITAYACFPASVASAKVAMPQYKEFFNGNTSGINVQNVGNADATITIVYTATNNGGATATFRNTVPLAPGALFPFYGVSGSPASVTVVSGNAAALNGSFGSAIITSTQPIVATQNESPDGSRPLQQDAKMYEGFNQ